MYIISTVIVMELVDTEPMPKVIDFGVAKATAQNLTDREYFTELGRLIGTPEYMSPEQAEMTGLNIDTRTDIYSLGAVLYELLIGALPFDSRRLRESGLVGIQNILRHEEPKKPSARFAELESADTEAIARHRETTTGKLGSRVRGDLDWITMKALEKDRTRRYASASGIAADVRRHLNDEPVAAGPPTFAYRFGKFRRRYRNYVAGAGIAALLIVGFAVVALWQWNRASHAEKRAVAEAAITREVNLFLNEMLAEASPEQNPDRDISLREVLDGVAGRIGESFDEQPAVRAAVQNTIGMTYVGLGLYDDAEPHLKSALEIREQISAGGASGDARAEVAESSHNFGRLLWSKSNYEGAEPLIRSALAKYREVFGEEHETVIDCLNDLAVVRESRGDHEGAETALREAIEITRAVFGEESPRLASKLHNLAWIRRSRGDLLGAEKLFREAIVLDEKHLGSDHPDVMVHAVNLALVLQQLREFAAAESLFVKTVDRMKEVLGPEHPTTLTGILKLGEMHLQRNQPEEARPLLEDALAVAERTLGSDHVITMTLLADVGWAHRARGDLAEAERYYRETLTRRERVLGDEHQYTIRVRWQVGRLLVDQGKFAEAEPYTREALEVGRRVLDPDNENICCSLGFLGLSLVGQGKCDEAEPLLRECLGSRSEKLPAGRWEIAQAQSALGACLTGQGRFTEAEPLLLEAHTALKDNKNTPPIRLQRSRERLVDLYESWHAAEPAAGKAAAAARWRAEL